MIQKRVYFYIMLIFNASVINSAKILLEVNNLTVPKMIEEKKIISKLLKIKKNMEECLEYQKNKKKMDKDYKCEKDNYNKSCDKLRKKYESYFSTKKVNGSNEKSIVPMSITEIKNYVSNTLEEILKYVIIKEKDNYYYFEGKADIDILDISYWDTQIFNKNKRERYSGKTIPCKIFFDYKETDFRKIYDMLIKNPNTSKHIIPNPSNNIIEYGIEIKTEIGKKDDVIENIEETYKCEAILTFSKVINYVFIKKKR